MGHHQGQRRAGAGRNAPDLCTAAEVGWHRRVPAGRGRQLSRHHRSRRALQSAHGRQIELPARAIPGLAIGRTLDLPHSLGMKLFLPSPRATNILLIIGFCAVGYALYLRYLVIEQSSVSLACEGGLKTWLCFTRKVFTTLFRHSVFGFLALAAATLHLLR